METQPDGCFACTALGNEVLVVTYVSLWYFESFSPTNHKILQKNSCMNKEAAQVI